MYKHQLELKNLHVRCVNCTYDSVLGAKILCCGYGENKYFNNNT